MSRARLFQGPRWLRVGFDVLMDVVTILIWVLGTRWFLELNSKGQLDWAHSWMFWVLLGIIQLIGTVRLIEHIRRLAGRVRAS